MTRVLASFARQHPEVRLEVHSDPVTPRGRGSRRGAGSGPDQAGAGRGAHRPLARAALPGSTAGSGPPPGECRCPGGVS